MENSKIRIIISLLLVFSISMLITACSNPEKSENVSWGKLDKENLKIIPLVGSFSVDVNNPKETIGDADYAFLGQVNQYVDTEYKDPVTIERVNGTEEITSPYTNYNVTVLKNIKGNLITDSPIQIQKAGGIIEDGSSVVLYEDDILLEEGESYIFLAYAQDDGSLLVSGPNSSIHVENIEEGMTANRISLDEESIDTITEYEDAYDNEKTTNRDRSISKFDVHEK